MTDKLDLIEYEKRFVEALNRTAGDGTKKYKVEEFGLKFDSGKKKADVYSYDNDETIVICPEPLEFIKEFDDVSDNTSRANELFEEKINSFQRIVLNKAPLLKAGGAPAKIWMNKTISGINLRPGNFNEDPEKFDPIRMSDDNVHGLIVGRTGSGKSVYINALILSLLTEYSPWELNLYLADFKKVELSRYMNDADKCNEYTAFTPHVNACAATSEIRYVISLIRYLVDCMNARQEFFARLGVTKIQEFRKKYNLVLPRVLLIVDEFQQLFTEATTRENEEIQTMLNSITKLGRATGFHLIFASQEMSGTLRGSTLANFKIRMALPCNQQISAEILGNGKAATLERGHVIINTDNGDELQNKMYRVPFIETDKKDDEDDEKKTPFYEYLDELKLESLKYKYELKYKTASQKFYREELQETESSYRKDLDRIQIQKNEFVKRSSSIFDGIILGKSVLYSPLKNDKVSFYIEKGRNKGIMIATPSPDDAARIRKLLMENLIRSDSQTYHIGIELNGLVLGKYRIGEAVKKYPLHKYISWDADSIFEYTNMLYLLRVSASKRIESEYEDRARVADTEKRLVSLLEDVSAVAAHEEYVSEKTSLTEEIEQLSAKIRENAGKSGQAKINPIIRFLEKCSTDVVMIKADNTKADFIHAFVYKSIVERYAQDSDLESTTQKNVELLELQYEEMKAKGEGMNLAMLQNKLLKLALQFYLDMYKNVQPKETRVSDDFKKCYESVRPLAEEYKKEQDCIREALALNNEMNKRKEYIQVRLDQLLANPDEITEAEEEIKRLVNKFIRNVFNDAFGGAGYRNKRPEIPEAIFTLNNGQLDWTLGESSINEAILQCGNDILEIYLGVCRGNAFSSGSFKKTVLWINGLDEVEKVPNQMIELIRNAINQNILVIAIITSELKDSTIRKAFDYSFVTGNIEKFYSMFDIKYTKQPADSIVVNFGIRSKGFDIPFKMYKLSLEEIQTPDFIDQLLNE